MASHKIYARHSSVAVPDRLPVPLIKHCVRVALRHENVDRPCEVSILITNDKKICEINHEFREINKPTDVLSFPMQEFRVPGWTAPVSLTADPETGLTPLGEIVLSAERVKRQAAGYGHSTEREVAYLTVHAMLHLLGYDHIDETEGKKLMRDREKEIMEKLEPGENPEITGSAGRKI